MFTVGMQTLEYPHLMKVAGDDRPRLRQNPRVRVSMIVTSYRQGMSVEEIVEEYPHLSPAEVHAALGYYYDHQEEIDSELAKEHAEIEEFMKNESPESKALRQRLRALRGKLE